MHLPPDRGQILTEQPHDAAVELDALPVGDAVALMIDDHRRVPEALAAAATALSEFIEALVPRMAAGGRLVYVGAGTSGRLGVLDAAECPPTFHSDADQVIGVIAGGDDALRRSSEGREDDPGGASEVLTRLGVGERDTVLGVAAGGTTPYVLGAIAWARRRAVTTGLLTCAGPPTTTEGCDHVIDLGTGPELLTGSTRLKAGSATKLALNIITTVTFTRLGKVYRNLMIDLRCTNDKLTDRAIRILCQLCPELGREAAARHLLEAGGRLRTAVVMRRLGVDAQRAETLLTEHRGPLAPLLDGDAPR